MKHNKGILVILLAVGLALVPSLSSASSVSDADARHKAAYQAYREAIERKLPIEEIREKLQAYLDAKATFDRLARPTSPSSTAPLLNEAPVSAAPVADSALVEPPLTSYPSRILEILRAYQEAKTQKAGDKLIQELEEELARNPDSSTAAFATYELAKAYETLKNDPAKATALYTKVAAMPNSPISSLLAKRRLENLKNHESQNISRIALWEKYRETDKIYKQFSQTSWLVFPVKIARFFSYLSALGSFRKAQAGHQDFMLKTEALAAPFSGTLEEVFKNIPAIRESGDELGTVRLLNGNTESWFARWKILTEARESIDIQYFIVDTDVFGMALLGLLAQKAREGVSIRFMTDSRGSTKIAHWFLGKDYLEELARFPNITVKIFNRLRQGLSVLLTDIRRVISSNHDKIIVVDGRYSIVGGRNIANEYLVDQTDDPNAWRDCDIVIDSPGVARELRDAFTEDFENIQAKTVAKDLLNVSSKDQALQTAYKAMDTYLTRGAAYIPTDKRTVSAGMLKKCNEELQKYSQLKSYSNFDTFAHAHHCPIKIIDKGSLLGPRDDITDHLIRLIDASRREIILQNPYVVLTPRAEAALKRAGKRGVRVLFFTNSPQTSDAFPTEAVMMADWRKILTEIPSCRIFAQIGKGQLHAKTFVFDREVGIVGTYNLDYVSEQINSEVVAAIHSPEFAAELRTGIIAALSVSKEYRLGTKDTPEFGPEDIDGKNMWLVRLLSKMKFLRPLF